MRSTLRVFGLVAFLSVTLSLGAHTAPGEMLRAASAFAAALDPAQKTKAIYALTNAERKNWNFVPMPRSGLPLKEMSAAQQHLAITLLRTGLSDAGYARAEAVMSLENVLKALETGATRRDPTLYYVTIFGEPSATTSWGWRFEGHHLSFNFTIVDGTHVFFVPSFIGSNPAEVRNGPRQGTRVLAAEDDDARTLLKSLDAAQRKAAVIATDSPKEILTSNKARVSPLEPVGIAASQLSSSQKESLIKLVQLYLNREQPELAEAKWKEIVAAGIDRLTFAWAGGFERGQPNYYRIQGPTFLIEFDNTQNNANHIHTSVREFKGDFGHDLLREHCASEQAK